MYELPERVAEEKKPKIKPFQVHFGTKLISGKSYVRYGLPLRVPHTVTAKISTKDHYICEPQIIQEQIQKLISQGPRDKYKAPISENQRYGWYYDVKFTNIDKSDNRVYFTKQMDHLIKLYLETMEKKH